METSDFKPSQDFKEYIRDNILDYLPGTYSDAHVWLDRYVRKDDEHVTALVITREGDPTAPKIILEDYTDRLLRGEPMDDILREIADIRLSYVPPSGIGDKALQMSEYDALVPKMTTRLYDQERNRDYLQDKVWRPVGALAMVVRIELAHFEHGLMAVSVTNDMLDMWAISQDQLFADAIESDRKKYPVRLFNAAESVSRVQSSDRNGFLDATYDHFADTEPLRKLPGQSTLYLITNARGTNGAATIAWPGVLEHVAELLDSSFYVLPSSTDECMLTRVTDASYRQLVESLRHGNRYATTPEELLSYKVHHYDRETGILKPGRAGRR